MKPQLPAQPRRAVLLMICAGLWAVSAALNLSLVRAANHQQVLTAEEASVSIRDVVFLEFRLQHNPIATSLGTHLTFWIGSHLFPQVDLFYARTVKALVMACVSPLLFLYGLRRLRLSMLAATMTAALAGTAPAMLAYSWPAIEMGLEVALGFFAILLAGSPRFVVRLVSAVIGGLGFLAYGSGLSLAPLLVAEWWATDRSWRRWWGCLACLALVGLTMRIPFIWWTNCQRIIVGGSILVLDRFWLNMQELWHQVALAGGSYYYFSPFPALGGWWLAAMALAGMVVGLRRLSQTWPLYLGMAANLILYGFAGGIGGIRRALPLVALAVLFLGCWIDACDRWLLRWKRVWPAKAAIFAMGAACLITPVQQYGWLREAYQTARIQLPIGFQFPLIPGKTMVETFEALRRQPNLIAVVDQFFEPDRALTMLYLLGRRNRDPDAGKVTKEHILQRFVYRMPP